MQCQVKYMTHYDCVILDNYDPCQSMCIVNHVGNDVNYISTIRFDVFGDQNGKGKHLLDHNFCMGALHKTSLFTLRIQSHIIATQLLDSVDFLKL